MEKIQTEYENVMVRIEVFCKKTFRYVIRQKELAKKLYSVLQIDPAFILQVA